jgi:putative ABC transport system substrate-binding protein
MKRRSLLAWAGGAVIAMPCRVFAQDTTRTRRLGALMSMYEHTPAARTAIGKLRHRLAELGWIEGRNLRLDVRWLAGDMGRAAAEAADLVRLAPDVLLSQSGPALRALAKVAGVIPIVFTLIPDPVGAGHVASLARPGGTVTGFTGFDIVIGGKWLEILKEIAPNTARVAVLYHPESGPAMDLYRTSIRMAASAWNVVLVEVPIREAGDVGRIVETSEGADGLIVVPSLVTSHHRDAIIAQAKRHRLPAIYPFRYFAEAGGLAFFGVDPADLLYQAAGYVDRLFRGAKPGDLPVQQPTKFELVINQGTARSLGLTVPAALLARADEVIE